MYTVGKKWQERSLIAMKYLHVETFQYMIITKVNVLSFPEGSSNPTDMSVTCFCGLSVLKYPAESDNWRTN